MVPHSPWFFNMSHGIFPFSQHFIVAHLLLCVPHTANDHFIATGGLGRCWLWRLHWKWKWYTKRRPKRHRRDSLWVVGGTPENPANPRIFGEGENGEHDMKTWKTRHDWESIPLYNLYIGVWILLLFSLGKIPSFTDIFHIRVWNHLYTCAWNPNGAPCFYWKRPCFGGLKVSKIEDIHRFQVNIPTCTNIFCFSLDR